MLGQLIWCCSIALEILLLLRGFRTGLVRRFPIFHAYIAYVIAQEFVRFLGHRQSDEIYRPVYWGTEFLALALGSLVIFEIYRVSFAAYPGAARMARNALAFVFLVALARGISDAIAARSGWLAQVPAMDIERALRAVQAAAILALVSLFLLYSVPFGRNLRGVLLGYGVFVAGRVICLVFVSQSVHNFWFYAYSASYSLALTLWLAYLWSYQPIPQVQAGVALESDYQRIAAETRRRLRGTRAYLRRAVRS